MPADTTKKMPFPHFAVYQRVVFGKRPAQCPLSDTGCPLLLCSPVTSAACKLYPPAGSRCRPHPQFQDAAGRDVLVVQPAMRIGLAVQPGALNIDVLGRVAPGENGKAFPLRIGRVESNHYAAENGTGDLITRVPG